MSTSVTGPQPGPTPLSEPVAPPRRPGGLVPDVLVTLVWFVVAGAAGAVVWWRLTTLPLVTKTGDAATVSPDQLVLQVAADGWYFVVAVVAGLLSGAVLLALRRRDPLVMVLLVTLGAGLAALEMSRLGRLLGPGPELAALRDRADGATVHQQLVLHAPGVAWMWPVAAALGALVYLWVLRKPGDDRG